MTVVFFLSKLKKKKCLKGDTPWPHRETSPLLAEDFRHFLSLGITVNQASADRVQPVRWKNRWLFLELFVQVNALLFNWCPIYCWSVALFFFSSLLYFLLLCPGSKIWFNDRSHEISKQAENRCSGTCLKSGGSSWRPSCLPPSQQLSLNALGNLVETFWR